MDKMLSRKDEIIVTNDCVTILKNIHVSHPVIKIMVEVAKAVNEEVGDGTTTAVVLANEFLEKAQRLVDKGVHPITIVNGYEKAMSLAIEALGKISVPINPEDSKEVLLKVALTAMSGNMFSDVKRMLAEIAVNAISTVAEEKTEKHYIDINEIKIIKQVGGSLSDSYLFNGAIVGYPYFRDDMPKFISNAKIAILMFPLEVMPIAKYSTSFLDTKIQISGLNQIKEFVNEEKNLEREIAEKIKKSGANVIICGRGVSDNFDTFLAKEGILCCKRVLQPDIDGIAGATGARLVLDLEDLNPEALGRADLVHYEKIGSKEYMFVNSTGKSNVVNVMIRGATEIAIDEAGHALQDAFQVIRRARENGAIIAGGGSAEMEIARQLNSYARTIQGREQLAIQAFAEALEVIPEVLASSAGLHPIDVLTELRALHSEGNLWSGIDVLNTCVGNMFLLGVYEPAGVKIQALKSATEAANCILRIDRLIASKKTKRKKKEQLTEEKKAKLEREMVPKAEEYLKNLMPLEKRKIHM